MRSLRRTLSSTGIGLVALLVPATALAWTARPAKARFAGPIALDAKDNVYVAIRTAVRRYESGAAIVKLGHRDGAELWRRKLRAGGPERSDFIYALDVAADSDVIAAGSLDDDGHANFFVARLAGHDGRVRWRHEIRGDTRSYEEGAYAVALDQSGDVIAAGTIAGSTTALYHSTQDLAVVKMVGDSGDERWRFQLNGTADQLDLAESIAVDAGGDVVVAGRTSELFSDPFGRLVNSVFRISGDDGRLRWRSDLETSGPFSRIRLDAAGDILIATSTADVTGSDFAVVKLSGATGSHLWTAIVNEREGVWQQAFDVGVLPSGDVAAVGVTGHTGGVSSMTAVMLDSATGAERWRQALRGSDGYGFGRTLAIGGGLVIGGQLRNRGSCYDMAVAHLDVETGTVVDQHTIDGTAKASECEVPDCSESRLRMDREQASGRGRYGPPCRCGPCRAGIDQDDVSAVAVDAKGRTVVAGFVSAEPWGRPQGLVATIPHHGSR